MYLKSPTYASHVWSHILRTTITSIFTQLEHFDDLLLTAGISKYEYTRGCIWSVY